MLFSAAAALSHQIARQPQASQNRRACDMTPRACILFADRGAGCGRRGGRRFRFEASIGGAAPQT